MEKYNSKTLLPPAPLVRGAKAGIRKALPCASGADRVCKPNPPHVRAGWFAPPLTRGGREGFRFVHQTAVLFFASLLSLPAAAEQQAWSFVQAVGGIEIGTPFKDEKGWTLPVRADVSGLQTITSKPTTLNSGLSCQSVEASIKDHSIYLKILTSLAGRGRSSQCPPTLLGQITAGKYAVFYRGPNEPAVAIGNLTIEP
jgi:hypothetical protein